MRAYKFLDAEGRAPFTATPWEPNVWVVTAPVEPCRVGVHACRSEDVAHWLDAALWEVELDDPVVESHHKLVAPRGRLGAAVEDYPAAVRALAEDGAWRCRDRAVEAMRAAGTPTETVAVAATLAELAALGADVDDITFVGRSIALAADAAHFAEHGLPSQSPFVAACSAGHAAAGPDGGQAAYDAGYAAERVYQSAWLAQRLQLS